MGGNLRKWHQNAATVWLLVAVVLGLVNLFLIVLLWNVSGQVSDIDSLSVSITVLEMFLAVVALGGFWVIRGSAREAAATEARDIAKSQAEQIARQTALDYVNAIVGTKSNETAINSVTDLMQALDEEGGDDEN